MDRYGLGPLVEKGTVEDVRIRDEGRLFDVRLADGRRFTARKVVCAMGPGPAFSGMDATRPWWADELAASLTKRDCVGSCLCPPAVSAPGAPEPDESSSSSGTGTDAPPARLQPGEFGERVNRTGEGSSSSSSAPVVDTPLMASARMQHSSVLQEWLLDEGNHRVLAGSRVLVVGGGQTAAHLAQLALHRGASAVTLCSRRRITQKMYVEYCPAAAAPTATTSNTAAHTRSCFLRGWYHRSYTIALPLLLLRTTTATTAALTHSSFLLGTTSTT